MDFPLHHIVPPKGTEETRPPYGPPLLFIPWDKCRSGASGTARPSCRRACAWALPQWKALPYDARDGFRWSELLYALGSDVLTWIWTKRGLVRAAISRANSLRSFILNPLFSWNHMIGDHQECHQNSRNRPAKAPIQTGDEIRRPDQFPPRLRFRLWKR